MKKGIITLVAILISSTAAIGQVYIESLFGLDLPIRRWTWTTDAEYLGAEFCGRFGMGSDAANIRFASENDTTDIILIIDYGRSLIHWLRASANPARRTLERLGTYGEFGRGPGQFVCLYPMAIASTTPFYDPSTDHIFVGDRMNHRIARLNFEFYPSSPQSDRIVWESSTFIDSIFTTIDLEYVDFGSGDRYDNKLLALDDMNGRLAVFSNQGDLLQIFDLADQADSMTHIYEASTHRVNEDGSVTLYLADRNLTNVRQYLYSTTGELSFVNEINLGDRMETNLADVIYTERFGLWALEWRGPHLYKLAPDLSRVLYEVSGERFNPRLLHEPHKICVFPDRLVVFEGMGDDTGILTFAFNRPSGKKDTDDEEIIPFRFALNQNYPNPFNPNTIVRFEIPQSDWVKLEIFNILGQKVKTLVDEYKNAGPHSVIWNGANSSGRQVATGVYFTRLSSGQKTEVKKMLLLR